MAATMRAEAVEVISLAGALTQQGIQFEVEHHHSL